MNYKYTMRKLLNAYSVPGFVVAALTPVVAAVVAERSHSAALMPLILGALIPTISGWVWGAKAPLPQTLFARLFPLFLPPLLLPVAYVFKTLFDEPIVGGLFWGLAVMLAGGIYICFYLAFLLASERRSRSVAKMRGAAYLLCVILVCAGAAAIAHKAALRDILPRRYNEASVGHGVDIWLYRPFSKGNKLVKPASPPSLRIKENWPRLDGAIAAFPVYAAFAQAVYAGLDAETARKHVDCTNTVNAYRRLVDGRDDIFFGAAPSREQREYAASKGLALTETPIGKEAFVFFVHKDNPVRSLTTAQVKAVYGGRIRNWKELGGPDEAILAFQRPEGSGSQSAMLRIMEGESMARPLREERSHGMGDIVLGVAAYRNRKNAVGYSFRWYATTLFANPDIRLLAIDGIAPSPENIRNGSYPFTVPLLAVTARSLSPQSRALLDWILGPEGQNLLAKVGYIPLR